MVWEMHEYVTKSKSIVKVRNDYKMKRETKCIYDAYMKNEK